MATIFDIFLGKLRLADLTPTEKADILSRITNLEGNEFKITYFEIITGTSGTLTTPTGATIEEDEFGPSGNAILSKLTGSNKPTYETPFDAGGNPVTVSLTAGTGVWITSGTYVDSSVALIYVLTISALDYVNLTEDNIIGLEFIKKTDVEIKTQYENNPDTNEFNDAEKIRLSISASEEFVLSQIGLLNR